jgi:Myotubularin-like phosphatase domain
VEQSGYLLKIDVILRSGLLVSRIITERRQCALIHCETGTVGSALVSSVAQIFVEPFYRTFQGFKALVNKEWAYFGYDFLFANGITGNSMEEAPNKPAFFFFLDCVFQLLYMNPTLFEFRSSLLVLLAHEMYTNKYREFLLPYFYNFDSVWGTVD